MKLKTAWSPRALIRWPAWHGLTRRGAFAWLGFAAGLLGVSWLHAPTWAALWEPEDALPSLPVALATLQAQLHKAQVPTDAPQGPPSLLAQLPARERQAVVWLQLSQLLAQHAVQMQSLRPVPDGAVAPLHSQAVAVRLHAHFDDWVAVWEAMNAHGPVWSIERLRIVPKGQGVDIEAVLRVWFGDDLDLGRLVPSEPATRQPVGKRVTRIRSSVFWQQPQGALSTPQAKPEDFKNPDWMDPLGDPGQTDRAVLLATEGATKGAVDPVQWPLAQIRLLGVWHQAQDARAILAAGAHWAQLRVGQHIGVEGHQLESIHPHEVHLRNLQGTLKVLALDKVPP